MVLALAGALQFWALGVSGTARIEPMGSESWDGSRALTRFESEARSQQRDVVSLSTTAAEPEALAVTSSQPSLPPDTPTPTLAPVSLPATTSANVRQSTTLTEAEVIAVLQAAGAPEEWIEPLVAISWCESKHSPGAVGDSGNSLGQYQLWRGWFPAAGFDASQAFDPLVNAKVAVYVRSVRGRFGGGGGWSCADLLGIY